ncbi:MAG: hypothetical protein ACREP9_07370, partial [Candidatus Dormibacteraceae bacterium]
IRALLTGELKRIRVGPFEAEWEHSLALVEARIKEPNTLTMSPEPAIERGDPAQAEMDPAALADTSPKAAVIEAYRCIEAELHRQIGHKFKARGTTANKLVRAAAEAGEIDSLVPKAVDELKYLRNLAANGGEGPSSDQALSYVKAAGDVITTIRNSNNNRAS